MHVDYSFKGSLHRIFSNAICTQSGSSGNAESSSVPVNCVNVNESVKELSNCSALSRGIAYPNDSLGNCSTENYTGSVCRQQLLAWKECAVGGAKEIFLDLTFIKLSQEEKERDAAQFLHFLRELHSNWLLKLLVLLHEFTNVGSFGSDHCQRAAGLLVCQIYFPLCDECQSGNSYLASRKECERLSMDECEKEWTSARQYGIPLPNCTDLPGELLGDNGKKFGKDYYDSAIACMQLYLGKKIP